MRAREFCMMDAYSFDIDKAGLEKSYQAMHDAYCKAFDRMGLEYRQYLRTQALSVVAALKSSTYLQTAAKT